MAAPTNTTPGAPGHDPGLLPRPFPLTVEALGREHRALEALALDLCEARETRERGPAAEHETPGDRLRATKPLQAAEMLAYDRARAVRDLALTLPARSWPDALAHLTMAMDLAETLDDDELSVERRKDVLVQLRRVHASLLPHVLKAAGPEATPDLVDLWHVQRHAFEFGLLEGGAP